MNLTALLTDNVTEILVKIVEFTRRRQKVIIRNITNVQNPEYVPEELEVNEFSCLVDDAVDEHVRNQRLVLRETENIKFGADGSLEIRTVVDKESKRLLDENREEYLDRQMDKLWENSLNQKVAAELLRHKQGLMPSISYF
jgi:flagellar basal body rod protein FlgB